MLNGNLSKEMKSLVICKVHYKFPVKLFRCIVHNFHHCSIFSNIIVHSKLSPYDTHNFATLSSTQNQRHDTHNFETLSSNQNQRHMIYTQFWNIIVQSKSSPYDTHNFETLSYTQNQRHMLHTILKHYRSIKIISIWYTHFETSTEKSTVHWKSSLYGTHNFL